VQQKISLTWRFDYDKENSRGQNPTSEFLVITSEKSTNKNRDYKYNESYHNLKYLLTVEPTDL